jgi:hypothetical protein
MINCIVVPVQLLGSFLYDDVFEVERMKTYAIEMLHIGLGT